MPSPLTRQERLLLLIAALAGLLCVASLAVVGPALGIASALLAIANMFILRSALRG